MARSRVLVSAVLSAAALYSARQRLTFAPAFSSGAAQLRQRGSVALQARGGEQDMAKQLYNPAARDAHYSGNMAQYLVDLHDSKAAFDFCGGMMFQLVLSEKLRAHLGLVAQGGGGDGQQPVVFDAAKPRMAQIPDYRQTNEADNVRLFHGREVRKVPTAAGGMGFVLQLTFAGEDPEGWTPQELAEYDGWGHDASRTWRNGERLESEGFKEASSAPQLSLCITGATCISIAGLLCAFCAALAFGVQYVPVKKYEIFDGVTFQWFMCSGILMVGFIAAITFNDFGMETQDSLLVVFGGALWAMSNFLVLPLVKLLGIGLGFSLYHFVNLIVGYVVGRFGLFGMKELTGSVALCDAGCALVLCSFVLLVFVEGDEPPESQPPAPLPPSVFEADQEFREMYNRWRQGEARGSRDGLEDTGMLETVGKMMVGYSAAERGHHLQDVGGFSVLAAPSDRALSLSEGDSHTHMAQVNGSWSLAQPLAATMQRNGSEPARLSNPADLRPAAAPGSPQSSSKLGRKLLGILLALVAGALTGVQAVPAALYNQKRPNASPTSVVFPQCLGIYICSSAIYLMYASVAKMAGWQKIPHSVIRPAYISGCIWAVGFSFMISAVSVLGFSVGYTLDAVGPIVVASLLSIFYFKEITDKRHLIMYAIAFALQLIGVVLMAVFGDRG
ncbi:unnamed protein product [Polarella glacialis]|uniref:Uncharacterized protein n=1 Tax=Polarella glacialis TaxID=89957 RepID=A0A813JC06_POLGL|nr:unnamed protein product [Polarella glacialis]